MRRRLPIILGTLAVVGLLATPVASAAPGQSFWESGTGRVLDECTGEYFDNVFNTHFVETDSGPSHFNTHVEGIGETSGSRYVGENVDNEFFHALPDGTFMIDQVLNVRVVGVGKLPNSWLTIASTWSSTRTATSSPGRATSRSGVTAQADADRCWGRAVLAPGPLLNSTQYLSARSGPGLAIPRHAASLSGPTGRRPA